MEGLGTGEFRRDIIFFPELVILVVLFTMVLSCDDDLSPTQTDYSGVLHHIELTPEYANLEIDSSAQFTAVAYDRYDTPIESAFVTWELSTNGHASVDSNGFVVGLWEGETSLSARIFNLESNKANILVYDPIVEIVLEPDTLKVTCTTRDTLRAYGLDAVGRVIPGQTFQWYYEDNSPAQVYPSGITRGLRVGEMTVTAGLRRVRSNQVRVIVEPSPPLATTLGAAGTTPRSTFLGGRWEEVECSNVGQIGFCWSEDPDPEIDLRLLTTNTYVDGQLALTKSTMGGMNISSTTSDRRDLWSEIAGLQPGTTYYYRAYSYTAHPVVVTYSENATFTTGTYETGTVEDIDGNVYQTVRIGDQWWMSENLMTTHYRNGDEIPDVQSYSDWGTLVSGALVSHGNDQSNINTYGALYNGYAVLDNRGLAPEGWHIPTEEEWLELAEFLETFPVHEADLIHYFELAERMKTIYGWDGGPHNEHRGGTNSSGFSAKPAGWRDNLEGNFWSLERATCFWGGTTEQQSGDLISMKVSLVNIANIRYQPIGFGYSVRCVKD